MGIRRGGVALVLLGVAGLGAEAEEPRRAGLDWWALQPLARPVVPRVTKPDWGRNPVDAFILAKLEGLGLQPAPPADRATLIRRATLDLLGLPPTPEEVEAFVRDRSEDAYARLIDRLLASPHYGERWGRHWLDLARFGESQGYERDKIREHAWRYRDYVIRSFNADKSYPQFIQEQLAGDVSLPRTAEGIVATGFLVAGPWDEVGAMQQGATMRQRAREEELEDMVAVVGQTFLGLTVNCARCHNHKFDPIPARDYYRFKAALEGVRPGDRPLLIPLAGLTYAALPKTPEPTFVLSRGDVLMPGERVAAGGLSAIRTPSSDLGLAPDAPEGQRRLRLAEWIAHPENPLTARVLVNRVWHYHFGRGLVATPNDFGFNGDRPSHPELLDWLAGEFVTPSPQPSPPEGGEGAGKGQPSPPPGGEGAQQGQPSPPEGGEGRVRGWSIKRLHKVLMLSQTYQQSARYQPAAAAVDAENRYLWRFAPRRLEGETVRDAMLAVSGQLNPRVGGPSYRPFKVTVFNSHFYELTDPTDPEYNRRTVYRMQVNSAKSPFLDALDCPDPAMKTPRRAVTTTPLQALGLMNNTFVHRQAEHFAERLTAEAGPDRVAQVARAYTLALGRTPTPAELTEAAAVAERHGLETLCWALLNSSEFLYLR